MKNSPPLINHKLLTETGFSLLSEGTSLKVRADGYSMYPSIMPGEVICITPLAPGEQPRPGDIIAWKRNLVLIVHRVVRIGRDSNGTFFITRGDSCKYEDPPVTPGQIAGKVISYKRKEGSGIRITTERNKKPCYRINRLRVFFKIRFQRLVKLLTRDLFIRR